MCRIYATKMDSNNHKAGGSTVRILQKYELKNQSDTWNTAGDRKKYVHGFYPRSNSGNERYVKRGKQVRSAMQYKIFATVLRSCWDFTKEPQVLPVWKEKQTQEQSGAN